MGVQGKSFEKEVRKTLRKLGAVLLLGRKKKGFFDMVSLRGRFYVISIHPYEPADEFIGKMEKALQEQGLKD